MSFGRIGIGRPVDADTGNVSAPAANTAASLTFAAETGKRHHLVYIAWSYSAAPTGGNLKVEDASGNTVFNVDITAAGPGSLQFENPLRTEVGNAMIVTLTAGGAGISGKLNAYKFTAPQGVF